jgi:hypothetical protein
VGHDFGQWARGCGLPEPRRRLKHGTASLRSASGVAGVRAVYDGSSLVPLAAPFVWCGLQVAGRQITLSGNVPSESARAAILAGARRALPAIGNRRSHEASHVARQAAFSAADCVRIDPPR